MEEYGDDGKVMAGGQSLILLMREGLVKPGAIINLMDIPGLDKISKASSNGHIKIGALATHRQMETSALIQKEIPLITATYQRLGNVQIRNMGTLGGNLCHNAPGSDPPPLLIALDATLELTGANGVRSIGVEEFGTDFYETALKANEILTKVHIPLLPARCGFAYYKYAARPMDMTVVGVAVKVVLAEDLETIQDIRIALGGVAPTTIRARQAEAILRGQAYNEKITAQSAEAAVGEIDPLSDIHGSADYRRQLTPVGIRRMVALAFQQAQAGQRQEPS
jgi:aerobic carbon-monoxide dehydrogenase medium subunit